MELCSIELGSSDNLKESKELPNTACRVTNTSITSHNYRLGRAVAAGGGVGGRGLGRGGGVVPGARPVRSEVSLALVQAAHLLQGEVGGPDLLHHLLAVCNKRIYKNMNSGFWKVISFYSPCSLRLCKVQKNFYYCFVDILIWGVQRMLYSPIRAHLKQYPQ